jgi:hypothetical protein
VCKGLDEVNEANSDPTDRVSRGDRKGRGLRFAAKLVEREREREQGGGVVINGTNANDAKGFRVKKRAEAQLRSVADSVFAVSLRFELFSK